jgi:hypothetical protein
MKALLVSVAVLVLMIGAQSAYAKMGALKSKHPVVDYLSGYYYGLNDANDDCKDPRIPCIAYVWKSPNGFINQTDAFIDGYVSGFCKIAGPGASMDEDEADFWCKDGPKSAGWMIGPTVRSGGIDFHRDPKLQVTNK